MKRRWCSMAAVLILAVVSCNGDGGDGQSGEGTATSEASSEVPFGGGNAHQVEDAIEQAGLELCRPVRLRDIDYVRKEYDMFLGVCRTLQRTRDGVLLIETFSHPDQLAAAATVDPGDVPDGLVAYQWAQFLVSVLPGTRPEAMAAFREAMTELEGAEPAFDRG